MYFYAHEKPPILTLESQQHKTLFYHTGSLRTGYGVHTYRSRLVTCARIERYTFGHVIVIMAL